MVGPSRVRMWLAFGLCIFGLVSAAQAAAQGGDAPARQAIPLSQGWLFRFGEGADALAPTVDPARWSEVSVPHTWNRVGYYIPNPQDHIHRAETVNQEQGIGWYRLTFTPPAGVAGRRAWLQFDAASRTAEVWLNGHRLGFHAGGFSRFRLDATAAIRPGHANVLVVRTDNSQPAAGSPTADVLPISGDFFVHGGLYRPASLIFTDPVHIDMLDFGGPGVYATTTSIAGSSAEVEVRTRLRNDGPRRQRLRISSSLIDHLGNVVASTQQPLAVSNGGAAELTQRLHVANARLWQGVQDPYLYRLRTELHAQDGQLLDSVEQGFGIRQMRLDPERGFFLNGRPLRLRGVGLHQDREGRGWALTEGDVAQDVAIIREMGANSIRLTHYQHGQIVHDLADRYGLILWDEIPLVTAWTYGADREPSPGLVANARQQLQELIRQNYNHASVAVWGVANEVDFGTARPGFLGGETTAAPDPLDLVRSLRELARAEDPNRPTALATCCEARGMEAAGVPITAAAVDTAGANRYFGWYYGHPEELGPHLDVLRRARPSQPLALTEYGAGGAITMHTDDPNGGPVDAIGRGQPEEYQSWVHEQSWRTLDGRNDLWATWLWNSFDFATTVRREGDSNDINTKGLVTYDRRVMKDAYFFYRANWSTAPTVHITGRRNVDRAYPTTAVRVYSNAPSTELTLNGRSLGALTACPQRICVWNDVRLAGGANRIAAAGRFASGEVRDSLEWELDPGQVRNIRIDSGALMAAPVAGRRFGSDAFFEGGVAATVNRPARWGRPAVITPIAGTADQLLTATYREGDFRYRIPLENGRYDLVLTFIEPAAGRGERVFDVRANGEPVLSGFDVAAVAGAPLTAVQRSVPVSVRDGQLLLEFAPTTGRAIVSAIEIVASDQVETRR